ncbi:nuclear transport factor 2 family protein [Salinibacterium soli]|uniref:Nuclear transport factor 2 family protein n=1 Tax=Antiquaquibacter soli TaxID=3064523 RepID=A0ABT9BQD6_9MICO|nr:nuclear transport factor 2 family protein [Protaetiibacter sp. WY-16]MDO7883154.1 nuclear transport factor 2 family protein [Protaetiibacter sp. WY-16]
MTEVTKDTRTLDDPEEVVRRYYRIVSDLSSTEDDLRSILAQDVIVTEHPNALVPTGARRNLTQTLDGFRRGKGLLREQVFEVHDVIAQGDRAAVRATWRGVVGVDAGPFRAGQELIAHVAAALTVRDGRVVAHETFDCYEPFTTAPAL